MSGTVQYPYAFDENNNLVFIKQVVPERRHEHRYHCPNCGHPMGTRQGIHNEWCFAHNENQNCGLESYIHSTAKVILAERFSNSNLPFNIHFRAEYRCNKEDTCHEEKYNCSCPLKGFDFNLRQYYDLPAVIETEVQGECGERLARPDVLIRSSNPNRKDILIEAYHTHKSSEEKIQSGLRIIEIRIRDFFDLERLETQTDFTESEDIHFYNFRISVSPIRVLTLRQSYARECGTELPPDSFPPCLSDYETIKKYAKCPRCGGNLIVRKSGLGRFYGCSNYPECNYTYRIY